MARGRSTGPEARADDSEQPQELGQRPPELDQRQHRTERIEALERQMTMVTDRLEDLWNVQQYVKTFDDRFTTIEMAFDKLGARMEFLEEDTRATFASFQAQLDDMKAQISILVRTAGDSSPSSSHTTERHKIKVPEPKAFQGTRDAKELENFLFDIEQYFRIVKPDTEDMKITMASMYLADDAKLWWRTKTSEMEQGTLTISTFEDFKKELKNQFLPENVDYLARKKLRDLKQLGSVRDYVKEFMACMLDIRDMTGKDKLFYFMEGLKFQAQNELRRQRIDNLADAIAAAERLSDYTPQRTEESTRPSQRRDVPNSNTPKSGGGASLDNATFRNNNNNNNNNPQPQGRSNNYQQYRGNNRFQGASSSNSANNNQRPRKCFFCDSDEHPTWACPQKAALNAMYEAQIVHPPEQGQEEEQAVHTLGAITMLNNCEAITYPPIQLQAPGPHSLLYMGILLQGRTTIALIDTGATHSFISTEEAKRLGIQLEPYTGDLRIKNVHHPRVIKGVAHRVPMMMNKLEGQINLLALDMDNQKVILGQDFLYKNNAIPLPKRQVLWMPDRNWIIGATKTLLEPAKATLLPLQLTNNRYQQNHANNWQRQKQYTTRSTSPTYTCPNPALAGTFQRNEDVCAISGGECQRPDFGIPNTCHDRASFTTWPCAQRAHNLARYPCHDRATFAKNMPAANKMPTAYQWIAKSKYPTYQGHDRASLANHMPSTCQQRARNKDSACHQRAITWPT